MAAEVVAYDIAAKTLHEARILQGRSRAELARAIGVSERALTYWEAGSLPSKRRHYQAWCLALGMSGDIVYTLGSTR